MRAIYYHHNLQRRQEATWLHNERAVKILLRHREEELARKALEKFAKEQQKPVHVV